MCFWDRLALSWLLLIVVARDIGIIYRKACVWEVSSDGFRAAITRLPSSDQLLTIWLQLVRPFSGAPEIVLIFDVVTFSAPYTRTSIATQILWIFCARNWWNSVANSSFILAFEDFDIFWSQKAPCPLYNCFNASSSAVRDRSEWFCWLTSRKNSRNARTAPITISSAAVSAGAFQSYLEQSRIAGQFTASVLILHWISLPCQELLLIESNGIDKCWRLWYRASDVNRLSNWSLTFLAFRYLISQCNNSLTKPRSSWWNLSGCQSS